MDTEPEIIEKGSREKMKRHERVMKSDLRDETIELESALIAGKEPNGGNISMYVGPLALDESTHNLFLINSGVIKILTRELDIKLDDCDDFLISAITEALV